MRWIWPLGRPGTGRGPSLLGERLVPPGRRSAAGRLPCLCPVCTASSAAKPSCFCPVRAACAGAGRACCCCSSCWWIAVTCLTQTACGCRCRGAPASCRYRTGSCPAWSSTASSSRRGPAGWRGGCLGWARGRRVRQPSCAACIVVAAVALAHASHAWSPPLLPTLQDLSQAWDTGQARESGGGAGAALEGIRGMLSGSFDSEDSSSSGGGGSYSNGSGVGAAQQQQQQQQQARR